MRGRPGKLKGIGLAVLSLGLAHLTLAQDAPLAGDDPAKVQDAEVTPDAGGVFVPPVKRVKPMTPPAPSAVENGVPLPERKPAADDTTGRDKAEAAPVTHRKKAKASTGEKDVARERPRNSRRRVADKESSKRN